MTAAASETGGGDGAAKVSICFVAHNAYGALSGDDTRHSGGIERQQSLMAKWLARRGHRVSMVTWDEGQADEVLIDGVRAFKMCRRNAGVRGLRFFVPKWTSLYRAMRQADAALYYYNCGDLGLGQTVLWCRRHRRKCVYSVASNPDCDPRQILLKPLRERILYSYGLRRADRVIAQTEYQGTMLREGFGMEATVIPMPCEDLRGNGFVIPTRLPSSPRVLWVGRISKEKRLEWLLDVAERCPDVAFDVVGGANEASDYASSLARRAAAISNVALHGRLPHAEMAKFYRRAMVLCCTSAYEGFPNTFLEAWNLGLPVVSTFDPDGVIARHQLGRVAGDLNDLVTRLKEMLTSPEAWLSASRAALRYYLDNHMLDISMVRFEQVFREAVDSHRAADAGR